MSRENIKERRKKKEERRKINGTITIGFCKMFAQT
jgi:hypothetical protein